MERSVIVVKYSFSASTSNCNMLNVNLQLFQRQKVSELRMGKHLPKTKKLPCETTFQKFHLRIYVLEILLFPSKHRISSRISTKIPFAHS